MLSLYRSPLIPLMPLMAFALLVCVTIGAAIWVFRPLDQAAKNRKHPAQFTLADFFCLFFLVQLGMTPLVLERGEGWVLSFYAVVAFSLMWIFGQQTLSKAGIHNTKHRILFEALIIPGAVCGVVAIPFLLVSVYTALFNLYRPNRSHAIAFFLGLVVVILVILFFGLLTRWLVRNANPPSSTSSSTTSSTQQNDPSS